MRNWNPDPRHLLCRDLQHSWSPLTAYRQGPHIVRSLGCIRCGAVKEQVLDEFGYIVRNRMKYPEGYIAKGLGRFGKHERALLRIDNIDMENRDA